MNIEEWRVGFEKLLKEFPIGQVLESVDGTPLKLEVILEEGQSPFIYGRAYVPDTVGGKLGWFGQNNNDWEDSGLKCVLMRRAKTAVINRFGLGSKEIYVKSLKVIRVAYNHDALLCEVNEW